MALVTLRFRRGTAAEWVAANPILALGEPGWETDGSKGKVGDGSTAWNTLQYSLGAGGGGGTGGPITASQITDASSLGISLIQAASAAAARTAIGSPASTITVNGHPLSANVTVTASDVGLGSVNNTTDIAKPISTATQAALDTKQNVATLISAIEAALPNIVFMKYYNTGTSSWPTISSTLLTDASLAWHWVGGDVAHPPPTTTGNAVWDRPT